MARSVHASNRLVWLLPAGALLVVMGFPALLDWRPVFGPDTPALIQQVLQHPLAYAIPALLPLAKLVMVVVAVLAAVGVRHSARLLVGYYAVVLLIVGVLQNAADLGGTGFAFLTGNALAQLVLAVGCLAALRSLTAEARPLRNKRTWVLPLALLAAAFPYATAGGNAVAGLDGALTNGAGVTYCMVTAVVAAVMFLRPDSYPGWLRVAVGSLGGVFGLLNVVVWFVLSPGSWWMGVLHLPLLICSVALLATSWTEARNPARLPVGPTV
ncbi:MAG: hypothetical protein IT380_30475 [Myxococcales bacterium]|nr:hypothetical protein [Myxococcales bacterium]